MEGGEVGWHGGFDPGGMYLALVALDGVAQRLGKRGGVAEHCRSGREPVEQCGRGPQACGPVGLSLGGDDVTQRQHDQVERRREELRGAKEGVDRERERIELEARKASRMLERFAEVERGERRCDATEEEAYAAFDEATRRREKLRGAVEDIRSDAPHLEKALERASLLLSI